MNLTGVITTVGDSTDSTTKLFRVVGLGYLRVDFAGIDIGSAALAPTGLDIAIPSGVTVGATTASTFAALSAYNASGAALTALAVTPARLQPGTERMVSQTDAQDATHKIFAVLVNPKESTSTRAAKDQTAARVQATVSAASEYWSDQSSGLIDFTLAGTVSFYKSKYSCRTDSGSDNLWREAAKKAAAKIGYKDAYNSHLVLFFPGSATSKCGGAIGLGTIGGGVNSGGLIWSVGTDSAIGKATLTHELGHNLSLGHANWADCTDWGTALDIETECTNRHYGDVMSVMGYGLDGKTGGSLSSASAIRSGIWSDDSYDTAVNGTTESYSLNAVSSNEGKRAVIVQDDAGVDYFVEYRNFTGRDAQLGDYGCETYDGTYYDCAPSAPGIRILRLQNANDVKGFWGDDDYLVGRTQGGKRVNYVQGESFATNGIVVAVDAVAGDTATVTISRDAIPAVEPGTVDIGFSLSHDQYDRVGDVWTAFVGSEWISDDYNVQWYADGAPIPGATETNYTIRPSDVGKYIRVTVTGTAEGLAPVSLSDPLTDLGYGPIRRGYLDVSGRPTIDGPSKVGTVFSVDDGSTTYLPEAAELTLSHQWYRSGTKITGATGTSYVSTAADYGKTISVKTTASADGFYDHVATSRSTAKLGKGVIQGVGEVAVSQAALTLTASVEASESGAGRAYQWYRGSAKISKATTASYTLTSADYGKNVSVRITVSKKNYTSIVVASPPVNYSVAASPAKPVIEGDVHVGGDIHVAEREYDHGASETAWQWYRSGTAIPGATTSSHTITAADRGRTITVKVTASAPGFLPSVTTSAATQKIATGLIDGASEPASIEWDTATGILTASSGIADEGAKLSYQWLRNGAAISTATKQAYKPTSGDYAKNMTVRVTATKASHTTVVKVSEPVNVTIMAEGKPVVDDSTPVVAQQLAIVYPVYSTEPDSFAYQWYASGTAISGATSENYTVASKYKGKTISVRVTARKAGYLSSVLTSPSTSKVVVGAP